MGTTRIARSAMMTWTLDFGETVRVPGI